MKFSIVLPTYNRAHVLAQTVQRLSTLNYPPSQLEIVVVDNNSTDSTAKVVHQLQKNIPILKYVFEKQQGRTFASLTGMKRAKHDKIIFIDDDIVVQRDLLRIYERAYTQHPNAAVIGGPILAKWTTSASTQSLLAGILQRYEPWIFGQVEYGDKQLQLTYPHALFAGNMSLNLGAFSSVEKTFSSELGRKVGSRYLYAEDYELCLRLELLEKEVIYEPALLVENLVEPERATNKYLLRRLFNSGAERYVVDQALSSFPHHESLKPRITPFILNALKTRNSYALWELLIRLPVYVGYISSQISLSARSRI